MKRHLIIILLLLAGVATTGNSQSATASDVLNRVLYIELRVSDLDQTATFYENVFGWSFGTRVAQFMSYYDGHLTVGFVQVPEPEAAKGGALVCVYVPSLEEAQAKIVDSGGKITQDIVAGAGGRRFQFTDPDGNELAVIGK